MDDIEKGEKKHTKIQIEDSFESDSGSKSDSGSSHSCSTFGSGSDSSSVYLWKLQALNHSKNNKDGNNLSSPPCADKDLLWTAGAKKVILEEDDCWKSFLLSQQKTCDSLERDGKTPKEAAKAEESQKEDTEEEGKRETNHDNGSACWSSDYYSATVSDDESSFLSYLIDEEKEDSVIDEPDLQQDSSDDESVDSTELSLQYGDNCFQMETLRSKMQFSNFQASLLETALSGMKKKKDQDHKRILELEQALANSEDMIADIIAEANLQHKERDMTDSLLQKAYEEISACDIQIAKLKSQIEDAVVNSTDRGNTIAQLELQLKKQKEVQADDKAKHQSQLDLSKALLLDAYGVGESRQQTITLLQESVKQLKAERGNEDFEKIEMASRLEETLVRLKSVTDLNDSLSATTACLERKIPKLELELRIMKAKYVLQEHFSKVNNNKREEANALFNQMKQRMMKKIELLDHRGRMLSNRLEEHLEKHKREVVQTDLLKRELQDTKAKLTLQKGMVACLQNELKQLKEQKCLEQQQQEVFEQVAQKQHLKYELAETNVKLKQQILERDLARPKKQDKETDVAESQTSALHAKLRFARAKESILSKTLSAKNSDIIILEERLKEMSEKLALMRSQLCMKQTQNDLLATRLEALQQEKDSQSQAVIQSVSGAADESLASGKSSDKKKERNKNCNRKVNSLEAELSLLQVPAVIVTDASLIGSLVYNESEKNNEDESNHRSTSDGSSSLFDEIRVQEVTINDDDEWDFLSHLAPKDQQELWC